MPEWQTGCVIIYLSNCLIIYLFLYTVFVWVCWTYTHILESYLTREPFGSPSCARAESSSQFLVTTLAENGIFSSGPKVPKICPVSSVANTSTAPGHPGPRPRPRWRKSWMLPLNTTYITRSSETPWRRRRVPCWCRSWWKQLPELCPATFFTSWWHNSEVHESECPLVIKHGNRKSELWEINHEWEGSSATFDCPIILFRAHDRDRLSGMCSQV